MIALRRDLGILWRHVRGGSSPPPGDPSQAPDEILGEPPIAEQIDNVSETTSQLGLDMAALEGRVIGAIAEVKQHATNAAAGVKVDVMRELKTQSSEMGVGQTGLAFLRTKTGRREAIGLLTLVVTAIGLIASMLRGGNQPASAATPPVVVLTAPDALPYALPTTKASPPPSSSR